MIRSTTIQKASILLNAFLGLPNLLGHFQGPYPLGGLFKGSLYLPKPHPRAFLIKSFWEDGVIVPGNCLIKGLWEDGIKVIFPGLSL